MMVAVHCYMLEIGICLSARARGKRHPDVITQRRTEREVAAAYGTRKEKHPLGEGATTLPNDCCFVNIHGKYILEKCIAYNAIEGNANTHPKYMKNM